jgi:hypothetical protein
METQETKNNNWKIICIDPWWTHEHQRLQYINEPFNDEPSLQLWKNLGYTQTKFTGDMYDMRNTLPPWAERFSDYFRWKNYSWSFYRMTPGCVLPNHSDTYVRYRNLYSVKNIDMIYRAVIFLEDWQSGHYFEIEGIPFVGWKTGQGVIWKGGTEHLAANMGLTDRFTLQITGIPVENPLL